MAMQASRKAAGRMHAIRWISDDVVMKLPIIYDWPQTSISRQVLGRGIVIYPLRRV
jgi:hypothetical protein